MNDETPNLIDTKHHVIAVWSYAPSAARVLNLGAQATDFETLSVVSYEAQDASAVHIERGQGANTQFEWMKFTFQPGLNA